MKKENFNIMTNIKIIEDLKAQLICVIGEFFRLLNKGNNAAQEAISECISGAIIILYVLAGKLGYSFAEIDHVIKRKLEMGIRSEDLIERDDKSLSKLKKYINNRID